MHTDLARQLPTIRALCREFGVTRLEVFGSAARVDDFDPKHSDADFLVEFKDMPGMSPLRQFFGFAEELTRVLGRPVDLVQPRAIRNPYVRAAIEQDRELVYAA